MSTFNPIHLIKKDRKLGISESKARYDLPLDQSAGTGFLVLLIALMSFLTLMTTGAGFGLSEITARWSSGLENALTIEIPASLHNDEIRSPKALKKLSAAVSEALKSDDNIAHFEVMAQDDTRALLSPFLGENAGDLTGIPLPALISVHIKNHDPAKLKSLQKALKTIAPDITLDTHEDWLSGILRLAWSLKISALLVALVIILTTITAIAGAVRSRMAEHKADIALLHMMGASDIYIMRQFQRHALILSLKGACAGALAGALVIGLMVLISGHAAQNLLPDLSLGMAQILTLLGIPAMVCAIAAITSRFTVLRVLAQMP